MRYTTTTVKSTVAMNERVQQALDPVEQEVQPTGSLPTFEQTQQLPVEKKESDNV